MIVIRYNRTNLIMPVLIKTIIKLHTQIRPDNSSTIRTNPQNTM